MAEMKRLHYCDYFMNQMQLHPCLRAALIGSNSLGPFIWYSNVFWSFSALMLDETNCSLQFLINKMDFQLPSCLWVHWHVYRSGLDGLQQCQSFRFSCACVWTIHVCWSISLGLHHTLLYETDSSNVLSHEGNGLEAPSLLASHLACTKKRS